MLKYLLFTATLAGAYVTAAAQNRLTLLSAPTGVIQAPKDTFEVKETLKLTHTSADTLQIMVARLSTNYAPGQSAYLCWDFCYGSVPALTDGPVKLAPNDTLDSEFYLAFQPNGVTGASSVGLRLVNMADPNEYIDHTFAFNTDPAASLGRIWASENGLALPTYDLASHTVIFSLSPDRAAANEYLEVVNLSGQVIETILLTPQAPEARIRYGHLPNGMFVARWYRNGVLAGARSWKAVHP